MDGLIGTEVGSYRLIRVLGEGGMGRVYVGEQAEIASRVAIKVLTTKDPDLVARFFAEARAVNVIKHPGLVKVLALSHLPDGRPYIIMELVEGETLRTLIVRDAPLPIGGVVDLMKQLLAALAAAHARGVVHRDLKPDNVMITADGTVKVLDFGIAKLSTTLGGGNLTQIGAQIGTPAYMAPEQIRGEEVDARTDVYATGVLLYEAITARHPFEAPSEYELLKGHLESPPPRLAARRRDVPAVLESIVEKALAKKPDDRFASAKELSAALDALAIAPQKLVARLPVTGPRTLQPPSAERATVADRPAPQPRATVGYKRPSQRPVEPTRAETSAPATGHSRVRLWLAVALVAIAGIAVAVAAWPRKEPAPDTRSQPSAAVSRDAAVATIVNDGAVVVVESRAPIGVSDERKARIDVAIDARRFDAIANLTKAQLVARQLVPNVVITGFRIDSANAEGGVDFDATHVVAYYAAIPNLPFREKFGDSQYCRVGVTVDAKGWEGVTNLSNQCADQQQHVPTCTLAEVWRRAFARKQQRTLPARIEWLGGRWLFAQDGSPQIEIDDDCAGTRTVPHQRAVDAGGSGAPSGDDQAVSHAYFETRFDIDHFDPIKFIPKAREFARKVQSDVDLTSIDMVVENTVPFLASVAYTFSTKGPATASTCTHVSVTFGGNVHVTRAINQPCNAPTIGTPHCTVSPIWLRAKPEKRIVSMMLSAHGWQVGTDDIYPDDCK